MVNLYPLEPTGLEQVSLPDETLETLYEAKRSASVVHYLLLNAEFTYIKLNEHFRQLILRMTTSSISDRTGFDDAP
jgi:hypothetical protein